MLHAVLPKKTGGKDRQGAFQVSYSAMKFKKKDGEGRRNTQQKPQC